MAAQVFPTKIHSPKDEVYGKQTSNLKLYSTLAPVAAGAWTNPSLAPGGAGTEWQKVGGRQRHYESGVICSREGTQPIRGTGKGFELPRWMPCLVQLFFDDVS